MWSFSIVVWRGEVEYWMYSWASRFNRRVRYQSCHWLISSTRDADASHSHRCTMGRSRVEFDWDRCSVCGWLLDILHVYSTHMHAAEQNLAKSAEANFARFCPSGEGNSCVSSFLTGNTARPLRVCIFILWIFAYLLAGCEYSLPVPFKCACS